MFRQSLILLVALISIPALNIRFDKYNLSRNLVANQYTNKTLFIHPNEPKSNGKYIWLNSEDSVTIPLIKAGRIFLIEAKVDGVRGYLVFDTGSSGVVLNKSYFRNHVGIKNQSSTGITGDMEVLDRVTIDTLEITGVRFNGLTAQMTNLGHIENKRGVKVIGLIGFSLFKDFEVIFDPGQNQLQLYQVNKKGERLGMKRTNFTPDFRCKFELTNNVLFMKAILGGKNLLFCFDTGAEVNVIDNSLPKSVLNTITITRRTTLTGTGSTTSEVFFGVMNGFQLGTKTINNLESIISNLDALSVAYDKRIDGMLGFSFISHGSFYFNFFKNELGISYYNMGD